MNKELTSVSDMEKWMKELRAMCREDVSDEFLESVLEELTESCYADTPKAQEFVDQLLVKYRADGKKLKVFIKKVARNCPEDKTRELEEEEAVEEEDAEAESLQGEEFTRDVPVRDGVR